MEVWCKDRAFGTDMVRPRVIQEGVRVNHRRKLDEGIGRVYGPQGRARYIGAFSLLLPQFESTNYKTSCQDQRPALSHPGRPSFKLISALGYRFMILQSVETYISQGLAIVID
ncbi:hypothetical protein YC2023_024248 [Brassica napus]